MTPHHKTLLEPGAVNARPMESGESGGALAVLARGTHWFGLGRTPHPVQAGNIWLVCLLKQKKEGQGAQVLCPHDVLSRKRESKKTPERLI